jgi:hypothetical protein
VRSEITNLLVAHGPLTHPRTQRVYVCLALSKCVGSRTFCDCDYGLGRRRVGARGVSVRARDLEELRNADEERRGNFRGANCAGGASEQTIPPK